MALSDLKVWNLVLNCDSTHNLTYNNFKERWGREIEWVGTLTLNTTYFFSFTSSLWTLLSWTPWDSSPMPHCRALLLESFISKESKRELESDAWSGGRGNASIYSETMPLKPYFLCLGFFFKRFCVFYCYNLIDEMASLVFFGEVLSFFNFKIQKRESLLVDR